MLINSIASHLQTNYLYRATSHWAEKLLHYDIGLASAVSATCEKMTKWRLCHQEVPLLGRAAIFPQGSLVCNTLLCVSVLVDMVIAVTVAAVTTSRLIVRANILWICSRCHFLPVLVTRVTNRTSQQTALHTRWPHCWCHLHSNLLWCTDCLHSSRASWWPDVNLKAFAAPFWSGCCDWLRCGILCITGIRTRAVIFSCCIFRWPILGRRWTISSCCQNVSK